MPQGDVTTELDLRDYLRVMRRRRGVIASTMLLVTFAAMAVTFLQRPVYEASAQILLQARSSGSVFDGQAGVGLDPARSAKTEIQVIESRPVQLAVQRELGTARGLDVSVRLVEGSDVIEISSRNQDASRAAAVANAFTRSYIELRRKQGVDELLAGAGALQTKVGELQEQIAAIQSPTPASGGSKVAGEEVKDGRILQALLDQQALLEQRIDEAQVAAILKTGGAQVVASASPPTSPVEPKPVRNAALAVSAGLLLGVGLAFLVDHLDDAVRTKDDLTLASSGLPFLGLVPVVTQGKGRGGDVRLTQNLNSPAGEAFRAIRTSLQLLSIDDPIRKVLVTSALGGEGKTTTVANLAVALARIGEKVVVVDCDLRRPRLHRLFSLGNEIGLTSVLLGDAPLERALQSVSQELTLRVMASGPMPPSPPELLPSMRMAEVLEKLVSEGWFVLLDSPPLLPVTDALVLAGKVDAAVLVVNAGRTTRRQTRRAIELLTQVDPPCLATVLNRAAPEQGHGYGYGYSYETDAPAAGQGGVRRRFAGTRRSRQSRANPATGHTDRERPPPDEPGVRPGEGGNVPAGSATSEISTWER